MTPQANERTLPMTCNRDCGGGCPLMAVVRDGRLAVVRDNPLAGPYLHGCVRGYQVARMIYAPDRLTKPLLRAGPKGSGEFREIPWAEALDRVADGLTRVRDRHGPAAIMLLGGSGSCRGALHHTGNLTRRFLALLGGYTGTYGSYSSGAASYTTPFVLGNTPSGIDAATLQHSRLILLWGANVEDCRLGCELGARVRQARGRGVPVIVIDPRRTRTLSRMGTEWVQVRPGTDSALMLAVLHILITEGLVDRAFAERVSVGFDRLERHVLGQDGTPPKTPAWAEAVCGTLAGTIADLARRYAAAKPTALIPGPSIQRTIGGEEAMRLAIALQVATGNVGVLGGSPGGLTWNRLPGPRVGTLPVPANPTGLAVPVYGWPDAILEGCAGGYPSDIHAVYNVGGNYLVQGADVAKSRRAFESLAFSVCHDYFLTPTARYCDIVLPIAASPEREDIVQTGANMLLYSHRAVEPPPGVMTDYGVFLALAERLGLEPAFSQGRTPEEWLTAFLATSEVADVEAFRRTGIYLGEDQLRVGLADFVADPEAHPLSTPSGKIELASDALQRGGFTPVPTARCLETEPDYSLRLVTPKSRYRVHSQHSNIPWFRAREEQALWIHPEDAAARGIADGDAVLVTSPRGRVRIPARVTDDIMTGVVCLLEGVWPDLAPDGADVAGCANVLTDTTPTLPSSSSRTHSVLVQVEATAPQVGSWRRGAHDPGGSPMKNDDLAYRFLRAHDWHAWRDMETDQRRRIPPPPMQKPCPEGAVLVDLVAPDALTVGNMPLIDAIRRRRSHRAFSDTPLSLEELSFLLWATQGLEGDRGMEASLRTVPSGGARHPFETYLAVQRVTGVQPGIYRYLPREQRLYLVRQEANLAAAVAAACGGQHFCGQGAVAFFWTAIPARTAWRYAIVAPKIVAQDSGHLCQNLYLAAEAIGAGTCAIGAYDQDLADALVGADGLDEFVIYAAPVGKIA